MCGINGIWLKSNVTSFNTEEVIQQMNVCLNHRGPDASGVYIHQNIGLGHVRLAILGLGDEGNQPMLSANGRYVLVYNGELYNYASLKQKLPEYPYKTNTDSEVILAYFTQYGVKSFEYFDGMFAFSILDVELNTIYLIRDRLGVKPLYFFENEDVFLFSSEIRPIIHSNISSFSVDKSSIAEYLRNQTTYTPRTIIKGVHSLPSGTYLELNKNSIQQHRFYDIRQQIHIQEKKHSSITKLEAIAKTKSLFYKAVEKRLISDVPFGAFLSGGIDSSAVVGVMSEYLSSPVNTFSVVFDEKMFSEATYAQQIAQKYRTKHCEIILKPKDILDKIPEFFKHMDHPTVDGFNTYIVSEETRKQGVKMVLSGIGGDELFAGYPLFTRLYHAQKRNILFNYSFPLRYIFSPILKHFSAIKYQKLSELFSQPTFELAQAHEIQRSLFSNSQIRQMLSFDVTPHEILNIPSNHSDYIFQDISMLELQTYLSHVLLRDTDQMSMAHALEVREPFLDKDLVEFVLSLKDALKYPYTPKELFVLAMQDVLPKDIIHRPKMGFVLPWQIWLKNELKDFTQQSIENLSKRDYFNKTLVLQWWKRFLKDDPGVSWSRIWSLVVLEQWMIKNDVQ